MKRVQVISSALNEEGNIDEFFNQLTQIFDAEIDYEWELIIFDNASSDNTWQKILDRSAKDRRFRGYRMSRTFTLDSSLTAGIDIADSDAVITMASDLQDDPKIIIEFLRKWEEGHDLVLARITKRADLNFLMKFFTPIYYNLASWASNGMLYKDVSDFRFMSRIVYENVRKLQERHRYMRGITAWAGFEPVFIDVVRQSRFAGVSNNKFFPVFNLAAKGILAQSEKAINLISFVGMVFPLFALISISILVFAWISYGVPFAGYGSIMALMICLFAINLFFSEFSHNTFP